ncbi:MAG: nitric oxide-sensing protein NosP [Rhodospirillaceae bacterium]
MSTETAIRTAVTAALDPEQIARELYDALYQDNLSLVLIFFSPEYDLEALSTAMTKVFGSEVTIAGCSTSGELTPEGYRENCITGVSFGWPDFHVVARKIDSLPDFRVDDGIELVQDAVAELLETAPSMSRDQIFSLLLIDGLSMAEDSVVSAIHAALDEIPLFGGSAGDGLTFDRTAILFGEEVTQNCAVLLFIATRAPFIVFKTEHFMAGNTKMVVTEADPTTRMVTEINAEPAAAEFARLLGLNTAHLDPMAFASHPVVVKVGGQPYVRSIQKVNPDGSLTFFCAIDEGIVLTNAIGLDIQENLQDAFIRIRDQIGQPQLVLGCDCVLRRLELKAKGLEDRISTLLVQNNVVGFSTYGEQFQAMHVNQTFTGVAIGRLPDPPAEDNAPQPLSPPSEDQKE